MEKTDAYFLLTGNSKTFLPFNLNITLGAWAIKVYWSYLMEECINLFRTSIDVHKSIIIAKLYGNDVRFLLYRRYKDGKVTKTVLGNGEYLNKELCPREFLDLFKERTEVLIASNCHNID